MTSSTQLPRALHLILPWLGIAIFVLVFVLRAPTLSDPSSRAAAMLFAGAFLALALLPRLLARPLARFFVHRRTR
ncbi:MAG: hypothetical protein F9K34_17755 [Albidovulum sp.]|uniref:hypothetical protein n=1 Tax=Albidovulum sp. TaxID=1872424 RepID=UPI0013261168|nr:hypothetical protein [Defluviimonas sp.]KAB2878427.1 MAG: hypothetical protein F9K34_17755 [Defluviimonas sp.]